jgi:hypothetical protein
MLDSELMSHFLLELDRGETLSSDFFLCRREGEQLNLYTRKHLCIAYITTRSRVLLVKELHDDSLRGYIDSNGYFFSGWNGKGYTIYKKTHLIDHEVISSPTMDLWKYWWRKNKVITHVVSFFYEDKWYPITRMSSNHGLNVISFNGIDKEYYNNDIVIWATQNSTVTSSEIIQEREIIDAEPEREVIDIKPEREIIYIEPSVDLVSAAKIEENISIDHSRIYGKIQYLESIILGMRERIEELESSKDVLELKASFILLNLKPEVK